MKFRFHKFLIVLCVYLFSANVVIAGDLICQGLITRIGNHVPGGLYLGVDTNVDGGSRNGELPIVKLCSLTGSFFRRTPEDCKHIASMAQQAKAMNQLVRVYIDNTSEVSCSDVPTWSSIDLRLLSIE